MATITYFLPDEKKSGGAYVTVAGAVKKIDAYERKVVLTDGKAISIDIRIDFNITEAQYLSGMEMM